MEQNLRSVLLTLAMLFWAINFHVAKFVLEYYTPMGAAAFRFLFGTCFLVVFLYVKQGKGLFRIRFSFQELGYMFAASFFGIFLTIYFFNKGLMTTNAINGSFIETANPIVIALFSILFLNQKATFRQWFAILISLIGVLIVLTQGDIKILLQLRFNSGDIYIMLMVLVFSLSQIIVKKYLAHIDAILMTAVTSLMSLILFVLCAFHEILEVGLPQSKSFWGSTLSMGILGTGIAYTVFYNCVIKMGAASTTLYLNLIPFFAVLLSFFFGSEIHFSQLIGGCIIVFGLLMYLSKLSFSMRGS